MKEALILVFFVLGLASLHAQNGTMAGIDAYYAEDGYFDDLSVAIEEPESVVYLDLSLRSPKLSAIPSEVFKFKNLRYLELGFNQIAAVDPKIEQLTELEVIGLDGNKYLNKTPVIPPSMTKMKEIHVKGTGLSSDQLEELKSHVPSGCKVFQ